MSAALSAHEIIKSSLRARDVIAWIDADPDRYEIYMDLKYLVNNGVDAYLKMMADRVR